MRPPAERARCLAALLLSAPEWRQASLESTAPRRRQRRQVEMSIEHQVVSMNQIKYIKLQYFWILHAISFLHRATVDTVAI